MLRKFRSSFAVFAGLSALMLCVGASMAFAGVSLEGVKCLMAASQDAKESKASEWKEGKVYFCCDKCLGKFDAMSKEEKEKIASKANAQLVASKQYVQKACPISGGELNPETKITVAGAEIAFCCNNCKAKAEGWKGDEQVENLFGEKAFKQAKFEVVKAE